MIPVQSTTTSAVTKRTEPLPEVDFDAILDETLAEMEDEGQPVVQPPQLPPHAVVPNIDEFQDQKEQMVLMMRLVVEEYKKNPDAFVEQMKQQMRGAKDELKAAYDAGEIPQEMYEQLESMYKKDNSQPIVKYLTGIGVEKARAERMAQHPDVEAVMQAAQTDLCSRHEELFTKTMSLLMFMQENHLDQELPKVDLNDQLKGELIAFLKRHLGV